MMLNLQSFTFCSQERGTLTAVYFQFIMQKATSKLSFNQILMSDSWYSFCHKAQNLKKKKTFKVSSKIIMEVKQF